MKSTHSPAVFTIAILFSILGGFFIGAFFGKSVFQMASLLVHLASRRSRSDQDRMKFELLLQ